MWEAHSLDHSDIRWGVERTVVNSKGLFQLEKFSKTFRSYESAVAQATKLNHEELVEATMAAFLKQTRRS